MRNWKITFVDKTTQWQMGTSSRDAVTALLKRLGKKESDIYIVHHENGKIVSEKRWRMT